MTEIFRNKILKEEAISGNIKTAISTMMNIVANNKPNPPRSGSDMKEISLYRNTATIVNYGRYFRKENDYEQFYEVMLDSLNDSANQSDFETFFDIIQNPNEYSNVDQFKNYLNIYTAFVDVLKIVFTSAPDGWVGKVSDKFLRIIK